jgi:hypothetical protein
MITVIMPTMWKGKQYKKMLPLLNSHHLIDDILIIDNDSKHTDTSIFDLEKVSFLTTEENQYVNPSWNMGVKTAYYNKLCFYSDDVYFDPAAIDVVYPMIAEDVGMIGLSSDVIFDVLDDDSIMGYGSNPEIIPCDEMPHGFASTFFLHKKSFHKIPEQLKIFFGDTFLFHMNRKFAKQNYMITGIEARTSMGTTSKKFKRTTEKEWRIAESILNQYGIPKEEWLTNH